MKSGPSAASSPATIATDNAATSAAFVALGNSATTTPGKAACTHSPVGSTARPTVTLQKDGDRVTHIRIQCACGEVVELECAY